MRLLLYRVLTVRLLQSHHNAQGWNLGCYCHSHSFLFRIGIKLYFKYVWKKKEVLGQGVLKVNLLRLKWWWEMEVVGWRDEAQGTHREDSPIEVGRISLAERDSSALSLVCAPLFSSCLSFRLDHEASKEEMLSGSPGSLTLQLCVPQPLVRCGCGRDFLLLPPPSPVSWQAGNGIVLMQGFHSYHNTEHLRDTWMYSFQRLALYTPNWYLISI